MANLLRPASVSVLLLAAGLLLSGCGNKGDLVLPPPMAETVPEDAAPAAEDVPPSTDTTEHDPPAEIPPPAAGDPPSDPVATPESGDGDG